MANLFERNLEVYHKIKPKNPSKSYTVIAGLNELTTGKLIALATGTQACLQKHLDDIEDCHAESLLKRAYKRYLIDYILFVLKDDSLSLHDVKTKIRNECSQQLVLSVSKFPCGTVKRYHGEEPTDDEGNLVVRKPGRWSTKDGKRLFVEKENCALKMKKWIKKGFQGSRLSNLFNIHSDVRKVIIGDCESDSDFDYSKYSQKLESILNDEFVDSSDLVEVQIVERSIKSDSLLFDTSKQPQPVAFAWWSSPQEGTTVTFDKCSNYELIVDGRKKGITTKQLESTNRKFRLKIGNQILREDLNRIETSLVHLQSKGKIMHK